MENKIRTILDSITHPETGEGIHDGGFVDAINATPEKITITLRFEKARDPFAIKIKKRVEEALKNSLDILGAPNASILVMIKEAIAPRKIEPKATTTTHNIAHTIAVASGKGGVGKSSVTANLAITLRNKGFRVGILDADIYGPSQTKMFGVEDFLPEAMIEEDGAEVIIPAEAHGIKIMSIGFFIKSTDPLMWRGTMASNALKQLLHQTKWDTLDFLLIDLPPGTGDIHLTILNEVKFTGAVIVSTPQSVAIADVIRGVEMFSHEKVNIPISGIIENMAYFTPDDAPDKKYYIFGEGGASRYAAQRYIPLLGEVPIYQAIMNGGEEGTPGVITDERVKDVYDLIGERLIKSLYKERD
ncbi:MAG: Mrp/NBP35 family ATP-binding protein [Rikenellaceae bacterium]